MAASKENYLTWEQMRYLNGNQFKPIAMRDLKKFVDPAKRPADRWEVIRARQAALLK